MLLSKFPKRRRRPMLVCEERVRVASLRICYRLYQTSDGFVLTISDGEESCAALLGNEPCVAFRFYADIVEGTVPPCTFFEIMEDRDERGVFQKISLQNGKLMV